MSEESEVSDPRRVYSERMAALAGPLLQTLQAFDTVRRQLHPPVLPALRNALGPLRERFDAAFEAYREVLVPKGLEGFHRVFSEGASRAGYDDLSSISTKGSRSAKAEA